MLKNGAVVRPFVGYERLVGEQVYAQLGEVYRAVRLYINCFQPSMKLLSKSIEGETVRRVYDPAKTPLQRLLLSGVLSEQRTGELREAAQTLDPFALLQQIDELQRALLRCQGSSSPQSVRRFSCHSSPPLCFFDAKQENASGQGSHETESRAEALRQPRSTRDPFADEWEHIFAFVSTHPGCSGGQILRELERLHPGLHTPSQLTTLAIGLRKIRAHQLQTRGETWPTESIQAEAPDPPFEQALEKTKTPQSDELHAPSAVPEPPASLAQAEESSPISQPETRRETPGLPEPSSVAAHPDHSLPQPVEQPQERVISNPGAEDQGARMVPVLPMTLAQAIDLFLQEEQALGRGPQTLDWHKLGLKQLQQYLTRRNLSLLSSVTETEVRGWLAFLRAEPSATGTIRTANTVMTAARSAHAFYAWAVRQGYLARTPFVRGMVPWYRSRQSNWQHIQMIESAVFELLLHACRPPGSKGEEEDHATARNRAMLWMMLEMGLLVSEVCALQIGDLDDQLQIMHIQGAGARGRQLPLGANTRRALRTYLGKTRMRMGKQGKHDPLFLSECCRQMTPNLITQLFNRLSMRAGITEQRVTPSILRETFAVRFLQAGGNLRALQEQLGLEDAVSAKRYQDYYDHAGSPSEKKLR